MAHEEGKTFSRQTIRLDGSTTYRGCTFEDCTLVYDGAQVALERPLFERCRLRLEGAAAATIEILTQMKDADPDLVAPFMERLFGSILEPDDHD
jgi:hypothetical protein